ncbi:MAG: sigma-70 family RNA polymerase sigma factor [Gammaproteobacteria bacterium]|nr:sigma-70 family RNA polymerase sigma factor [Gammaproteobacteria bacterium]
MAYEASPSAANTAALPGASLGDETFLGDLRRQMLKFATLQMSDAAEDTVQEAPIGAMQNAASFGGRSAFKTWVFAILKNEIADELRRRQRLAEVSQLLQEDDEDAMLELFDRRGLWHAHERPQRWADPDGLLEDVRFLRVFEVCLEHLPGRQARVFMMREFVELETHEICASLGLTVSNVNVMLHRARLRLRECLENHWFLERKPC